MAVNGIAAWNIHGGTINTTWTYSHVFNMGASNIYAHGALNYVGETSDQTTSWLYIEGFVANGQSTSGLTWASAFINGCTQITYWFECTDVFATGTAALFFM